MRTIILALLCVGSAPLGSSAQSVAELRRRANSDDARTIQEASFHGEARATVIRALRRNELGVGGGTFRVKRHPSGNGSFVYEPQTRFNGVERLFVWWVNGDGTPFAVNGASKGLTTGLDYAPKTALQPADQVVRYVFRGEALPPLATPEHVTVTEGFTVKEYHAYRFVIDTPMSVSEDQAVARVARCLNMTREAVTAAIDKVQRLLFASGWLGRATEEVRHASDWNGDAPSPRCPERWLTGVLTRR